MSRIAIVLALGVAVGTPAMVAQAQSGAFAARIEVTVPKVLTAAEVARALPVEVLFKGQTVRVERGNSGGAQWADGSVMMAGLVETRGASSTKQAGAEQQPFQAYFVTKAPLAFGEQRLKPGTYGVEFAGSDFVVMDLAGREVMRVEAQRDDAMKAPVPLQVTASGLSYRLYGGRSFVSFEATP
jgi:hypothetical protein